VSNASATRATRLSKAKAPLAIDAVNEQENFVIVIARLSMAKTVAVERLHGFQFPALVVAVLSLVASGK